MQWLAARWNGKHLKANEISYSSSAGFRKARNANFDTVSGTENE